ncbi:MAG TPA: thioredoxin family protein [Candidatus Absconditabacterales bacterium]|nr:thioredoxin family protein [Candidatus Absconditabacterales bacterium]
MAKQVIKFYADWCGPCRMYTPTFDRVKEELQSDEISFKEVNVENDPENLAAEYKVRGIPLTVVVDNGEVRTESGRLSEEMLKKLING